MNILITGSGGYLGGRLTNALSKKHNIRTVSSQPIVGLPSLDPNISNMMINWMKDEDLVTVRLS